MQGKRCICAPHFLAAEERGEAISWTPRRMPHAAEVRRSKHAFTGQGTIGGPKCGEWQCLSFAWGHVRSLRHVSMRGKSLPASSEYDLHHTPHTSARRRCCGHLLSLPKQHPPMYSRDLQRLPPCRAEIQFPWINHLNRKIELLDVDSQDPVSASSWR